MEPLILLVVFVAFIWLLVLRPARKQQQQAKQLQDSVAPGSRIMLSSGIYGTVDEVHDDDTLSLIIAQDVVVDVDRRAVSKVFTDDVDEAQDDTEEPLETPKGAVERTDD